MDFKTQVIRTTAPEDHWDQRKSTGSFLGSEEGHNVRTVLEFRDDADLADLLTNPERLAELIHEGDNALMVVNRILARTKEGQPALAGPVASVLGLGGSGPVSFGLFAYDND